MFNKKIYVSLLIFSLILSVNGVNARMTRESHALYKQACAYEYNNDYESAIKVIQYALEQNGEDVMLYTKIAGLYADTGKYEEALGAYKKAIKLRPNDAFIYISIGNILQTMGDYENAYNSFKQAQTIYPEYKYNYLNLANIEYFRKNYKEAIEYYNTFLSTYPEHKEASENLANVYYLLNNPEKACEIYATVYKKYPSAFSEFEKYGIALFDTKQYQAAAEMLERALQADEKNEMILAKLAITYQNLSENKKALEYYTKTFEINPNLAEIKFDYANLLGNMDKNNEAIEAYKEYLKAFPDVSEAYRNLGLVYKKVENLDLALFNLEKAYSMDNSDFQTKKELAYCYHSKNDYNSALKYYDIALKSEPDNAELLANKALVLHAMKNYIPAIEIYKNLLLKQPNERLQKNLISASVAYGYELYDKQDYGQAILYFEDAIALNEKETSAYFGYAKTSEKMGCNEIALEYYRKAIELDPSNKDYISTYEKFRTSCIKEKSKELQDSTHAKVVANTPELKVVPTAVEEKDEKVNQNSPEYLLKMGNNAYSSKNYDEALDYYTKYVIYNPNNENIMLKIANIYKLKGNNAKALNFYDKILTLNPKTTDAYFNKGLILATQKRYDDCIKCFEKVTELSPDYPYAYYSIAMAYEQKGDVNKALEYYYLYSGIETNDKMLTVINQKIKKLEAQK